MSSKEQEFNFIVQLIDRPEGGQFIMSIGEQVKGITITAGVDMLKQLHHLDVPPGELYTYDYDGLNRDPQKDTFGDRITLRYVTSE